MKLNDKQKVIAVALFFLVLIGGVSGLNFMKSRERSRLLAHMDRLHRDEGAAQLKIKKIPRLLEERANLIANINKYAEILPPEEHVQHDAFVKIIDNYRQDTKIIIQKADYIKVRTTRGDKEKKAEQSFIRHRYRFSLLGTVPDLIEFVNKIENHTRFLKVDALRIDPYGDAKTVAASGNSPEAKELAAASSPIKEIDLTISTYTYKGAKGDQKS